MPVFSPVSAFVTFLTCFIYVRENEQTGEVQGSVSEFSAVLVGFLFLPPPHGVCVCAGEE